MFVHMIAVNADKTKFDFLKVISYSITMCPFSFAHRWRACDNYKINIVENNIRNRGTTKLYTGQ